MTTPTDIIRQAINYQLRGVNTAIPAEIVSYDYTQQRADVKPLLNRKYKGEEEGTPLPIITNVPVIFPRGGNFSMHWPLNAGDTILLVFSERSLDEWVYEGGQVTPNDPRMFNLSDAIAIPGLIPFSEGTAEDNTNFNLTIGSSRMRISPTGTFCFHGLTDELVDLIQQIVGQLVAFNGANGAGPVVLNPAYILSLQALQAKINAMKGDC